MSGRKTYRTHAVFFAAAVVLLLTAAALAQDNAVQVTFGDKRDVDPAASPDGKRLVFASNRTGDFCIYAVTFGEAGVVQLTQSEKDDRQPCWSPDGKKVIFTSRRTGHGDLYEMASDGSSGFLQITDRGDVEEWPSYAPKSGGLLFVTGPYKRIQIREKMNVVVADAAAQANTPRLLTEGDEPRYSPDGSRVLFVSRRTKNKDVWVMSADGGLQTQLTNDPKDDENPCWSPDGKHIVFASERTGNFDLWVMNTDGTEVRQLTSTPAHERQPSWSSTDHIYFTREASSSQSNIFRINAP
ncbi:MAG: PD40 domain-containing protein [Candidatus Hydrogenedentes bacterium]|nr:PD40 domain-containing protein [Candidatus Hydrogenedentota bacterium]